MLLTTIRAAWPEKRGFSLFRVSTKEDFIFIHALSDAEAFIDGKWRSVQAGDLWITSAHTSQGIRSTEEDLLHDWFHLRGDVASVLASYDLRPDTLYRPHEDAFISSAVHKVEIEFFSGAPYAAEIATLIIEQLLARIGRALKSPEPRISPYLYPRFSALRSEVLRHYHTPPSVSEMASALSLSPSRFHKLYKSYFGVSPAHDIVRARIDHARLLLLDGSLSVTEVAEQIGFSDIYSFIRRFKAEVGVSPGVFRRTVK